MEYEFLNSSIERENLILPNSDKINQFLLRNNREEIIKYLNLGEIGIDYIRKNILRKEAKLCFYS